MKPHNILISRFSALGDIAMTIPTVYNACRANPDMRFFFLTRKHPARLFIEAPENLTVIPINTDDYKGISGIWRLSGILRRDHGIDGFVDLHDVLRTQILRTCMRLRGIHSYAIKKGRRAKHRLTRRHNKTLRPLTPTPRRYDAAFDRAGISLAPPNPFSSVFQDCPDSKGNPDAFASVSPPKQAGEHWLAIAPFARHKGKIYPMELLDKVIAFFNARPDQKIFIFGFGPEESARIAQFASRYPAVVNMAEANIGIAAELSLLSHCDTMLSMDSANMHMASLVGLRTVSIWGATHPYTGFLGRGQSMADTVQLDMTCRPCSVFGDKPCFRGDYHCLSGITPQIIIQRILNPTRQTPSDKP